MKVMSVRKTERNQAIADAITHGEHLKDVAARFNISIARVSKIARSAGPQHVVTLDDVQPILLAMQTLLNSLLNR